MKDDFQIPNLGTMPEKYDQSYFRRLARNIEQTFTALRAKGSIQVSDITADNLTVTGITADNLTVTNPLTLKGVEPAATYVTSSAATFTVIPAHRNAFIRLNAGGTATLNLPDAATVGSGFRFILQPYGTWVNITPATGTINGSAVQTVKGGQLTEVVSDGTNWFATVSPWIIPDYFTKSANYTPVFMDYEATIRCTASLTLSPSATTVGYGWKTYVHAYGGAVTIDPSSTQTINGQTTLVLPRGVSGTLYCDGSNFFFYGSQGNPGANDFSFSRTWARNFTSTTSQSFLDFAEAGNPKLIEIDIYCASVSTAATVSVHFSIDNGATWTTSAGSYGNMAMYSASGTTTAQGTNSSSDAVAKLIGYGSPINTAHNFGGRFRGSMTGMAQQYSIIQGIQTYYNTTPVIVVLQSASWSTNTFNAMRITSDNAIKGDVVIKAFY